MPLVSSKQKKALHRLGDFYNVPQEKGFYFTITHQIEEKATVTTLRTNPEAQHTPLWTPP